MFCAVYNVFNLNISFLYIFYFLYTWKKERTIYKANNTSEFLFLFILFKWILFLPDTVLHFSFYCLQEFRNHKISVSPIYLKIKNHPKVIRAKIFENSLNWKLRMCECTREGSGDGRSDAHAPRVSAVFGVARRSSRKLDARDWPTRRPLGGGRRISGRVTR